MWKSQAAIVPSFCTAARTVMTPAGRKYAHANSSSRVHTTRILALSEDLPILLEAVDEAERVRAVLPELEAMVGGGLITLEQVEVIVYRSGG